MRTLAVLLATAPAPGREAPWALVDADGALAGHGRSSPDGWPAAERRVAVLAATAVRTVALTLPPIPPARLPAAAAFAVEERLATPVEDALVVPGAQQADGSLVALVLALPLARALAGFVPPFDRIVAEPQLAPAPAPGAWRWCASERHGFVLAADGSAFGTGPAAGDRLPDELAAALAHAARAGTAPLRLIADVDAAAAHRDAWARAGGVPVEAGRAWAWTQRLDAAPDLAPACLRAARPAEGTPPRRSLRFALGCLAAAAVLHVAATAGTWGWRTLALARTEAAIAQVAGDAGATDAQALAQAAVLAHHRAGAPVAADAWPLLARAAPALAALPAGSLRSARYAGGAWTLDVGGLDDAALAAFDARLQHAGLAPVLARNAQGLRVRVEPAP